MFKLNEETLLLITENCTYRVRVADQIDRDRTESGSTAEFSAKAT